MHKVDRDTTLEAVFAGTLTCLQYRQGYRFNQDSVLLAHFINPHPDERVLDLGTGCGIIGLILAYRYPLLKIVGLEIQPDLALLARRNSIDNGFGDRFDIMEGDLNNEHLLEASSFERIICNPPYMDPEKSRHPKDIEVAVARQGIQTGPRDLVSAAHRLLVDGGRFDVVYPADRVRQLLSALKGVGLSPDKIRSIHSYPGAPEMLVMIEAEKNGDREIEVLPPLNISLEKGGEYSPEVERYYELGNEQGEPQVTR